MSIISIAIDDERNKCVVYIMNNYENVWFGYERKVSFDLFTVDLMIGKCFYIIGMNDEMRNEKLVEW